MRCEKPIVAAWIELVGMSNLNTVSDLHLGTVGPLVLELSKFERLVNSIIVEFFLVDLIGQVLERKIHPVEDIKRLDSLLKELGVDDSTDDVLGKELLKVDHQIKLELIRHDGHELHYKGMLAEPNIITLCRRSMLSHHLIESV